MRSTFSRVSKHQNKGVSRPLFPKIIVCTVALLFALPAAAQSISTEVNTDRSGMDYRNYDMLFANPALCRKACEADNKCIAYTYVKPGVQGPKPRCWLKSGVPAARADSCCVSGVKLSAALEGVKPGMMQVEPKPAVTPEKVAPVIQQIHSVKAKEPDALGKGNVIGAPGDDPAHMPACGGGGALDSVMDVVSFIVNQFGGNISHHAYCGNEKREVAAGVTLAPPPAAKEPQPHWGYIGGQGDLMADAAVCLIKDIGNVPGGRIDHKTPTTGGAVPVSAEQIVGLKSFDPAAKKAVFYHVLRACAPLIGCMDATRQEITAQVRSNVPAWPENMRAGDFPITGSYAVEMDSQWSASDFNITLPQITIPTPYGILKAQPKVTWAAGLRAVETPFPTKDARVTLLSPKGRGTATAVVQDTYGLSGMPFIIQVATNLYHPPQQGFGAQQQGAAEAQGWSSQIGFGGRNGSSEVAYWNPGTNAKNPPLRADLNLDTARSPHESWSNANFTAQMPITYSPPNPLELLPAAIRSQASMSLTITVNPQMAADYASQVALISRDANYTNCTGIEFGTSCNLSEVLLPMQVKATGRMQITGNVALHISFSIPFVPDVDVNQPFHVKLSGGEASMPSGYAESNPYPHVARATRLTYDRPDKKHYGDTLIGPSGQNASNLENWRQACLAQTPKTTTPPPPSRQPDNKTYMPELLPCNICATDSHINSHNNGNPLPRIFDVAQHSYGANKEWVCEWKGNQGCYDLCSWDKNTGKFIAAVQSAVDIVGGRCTSHEQIIK